MLCNVGQPVPVGGISARKCAAKPDAQIGGEAAECAALFVRHPHPRFPWEIARQLRWVRCNLVVQHESSDSTYRAVRLDASRETARKRRASREAVSLHRERVDCGVSLDGLLERCIHLARSDVFNRDSIEVVVAELLRYTEPRQRQAAQADVALCLCDDVNLLCVFVGYMRWQHAIAHRVHLERVEIHHENIRARVDQTPLDARVKRELHHPDARLDRLAGREARQ